MLKARSARDSHRVRNETNGFLFFLSIIRAPSKAKGLTWKEPVWRVRGEYEQCKREGVLGRERTVQGKGIRGRERMVQWGGGMGHKRRVHW